MMVLSTLKGEEGTRAKEETTKVDNFKIADRKGRGWHCFHVTHYAPHSPSGANFLHSELTRPMFLVHGHGETTNIRRNYSDVINFGGTHPGQRYKWKLQS
jgi:hypothetical protein